MGNYMAITCKKKRNHHKYFVNHHLKRKFSVIQACNSKKISKFAEIIECECGFQFLYLYGGEEERR